MAIALDYSYVSSNGGETSAVNKAIGVMNTVDMYFDDSFNTDVDFAIVEMFVSTCAQCDPSTWTSTLDALELLNNFGTGAAGTSGFSTDFDLGQIWTNRNIEYEGNSYVVALAWRPGVCYSKYHLLEDYTNNHNRLSTLTAHEIGYNFGSKHDTIPGHIMYSSVNGSGSWSQLSKDAINTVLSYASLSFRLRVLP
ncbi:MAG: hypothetical protein HKN87_21515 [Saprospiraceae bacterium]|nr:hypothetical protein [Saprospiraceae bacterium]